MFLSLVCKLTIETDVNNQCFLFSTVLLILIENRLFAYKPCCGESRPFTPNRFGPGTFRLGYSLTFHIFTIYQTKEALIKAKVIVDNNHLYLERNFDTLKTMIIIGTISIIRLVTT